MGDHLHSRSDYHLHTSYLMTPVGKLKSIAVVTGVFGLALTASVIDNGIYYNYKCNSFERAAFEKDAVAASESENGTIYSYCEQIHDNTFQQCELLRKLFLEEIRKHPGLLPTSNEYYLLPGGKPCPHRALIIAPLAMIALSWVVNVITLVMQMFVENFTKKYPAYSKIDLVGHFIAVIFRIVACVLMAALVSWIFSSNYPCVQQHYDCKSAPDPHQCRLMLQTGNGRFFESMHSWTGKSRIFGDPYRYFDKKGNTKSFASCLEEKNFTYQIWMLLWAIFFNGVTGVVYGYTVMVMLRARKRIIPVSTDSPSIIASSINSSALSI